MKARAKAQTARTVQLALVGSTRSPSLAPRQRVLGEACGGRVITDALPPLHARAMQFELRLLGSLLEMALVEAGRMVRRAEMRLGKAAVQAEDVSPVSVGPFRAVNTARAAGEIADVLVALRARAQDFDLKFLSYLLEMAFIEAYEQSRKGDTAV